MRRSRDLLRIDADAAARKLSEKRFKSASDAAAALVRTALLTGPRAVHLQLQRNRAEIRAEGGAMDGTVFLWASLLFDPKVEEAERLEALGRLEHSGSDFLAAFTEPYQRVLVEWRSPEGDRALLFVRGKPPMKTRARGGAALRIAVEGKGIGNARISSVARYCRYAEVPVYINRMRVDRGGKMAGCPIQRPLTDGELRGYIGIPKEGELSCVVRLSRGIVVEEAYFGERRGLVVEAAVEGASREIDAREILDRLRAESRALYREAAARYPHLKPSQREAVKERLLARYEHSFDRRLVENLPLFAVADGHFADFFEVKRRADREIVFGVDDTADLSDYMVRRRFVLLLSAREKRFFQTAMALVPPEPPRRVDLQSWGQRLRGALSRFADRLLPRPAPVPESSLTDDERAFSAALAAQIGRWDEVLFVSGKRYRFPRTVDGKKQIFIPRNRSGTASMIRRALRSDAHARWALRLVSRGALPS